MKIEKGKYYFMTKHRDESWIVKVNALENKSIIVHGISPGKKKFVQSWVIEDSEDRVFTEADNEQIRHHHACMQLGMYRSKPRNSNTGNNSYEIF